MMLSLHENARHSTCVHTVHLAQPPPQSSLKVRGVGATDPLSITLRHLMRHLIPSPCRFSCCAEEG